MTAEGANNKSQKLAEALKAAASIASLLADQRAKKKVTLTGTHQKLHNCPSRSCMAWALAVALKLKVLALAL